MSPFARAGINVLAGTLTPTLAALGALNVQTIVDVNFWLATSVVMITSFSAALSTQIASLVRLTNPSSS